MPFTFGSQFAIAIRLSTGAQTFDRFAELCRADAATSWNGISSVKDANGLPITGYAVLSASGTDYTRAIGPPPRVLWSAGDDLLANEVADAVGEIESINATVPQWSYGYRSTAAGATLTPFTAAQHQNGVGHPEVDGWIPGAGVLVNTGSVPVSVDLGGASSAVRPGQLLMQPTANQFAVARWTAPEAGSYNIAARWVDVQTASGNGASGHVVVNGVQIFGGQEGELFTGAHWANGGKVGMAPRSLRARVRRHGGLCRGREWRRQRGPDRAERAHSSRAEIDDLRTSHSRGWRQCHRHHQLGRFLARRLAASGWIERGHAHAPLRLNSFCPVSRPAFTICKRKGSTATGFWERRT